MLEAWRRIERSATSAPVPGLPAPATGEETALVGRIFVLERQGRSVWNFRTAGEALGDLLGRPLPGRDFLNLWNGSDREMVRTLLESVASVRGPALIRATGETLAGRQLPVEVARAPLPAVSSGATRVLGHYQGLADTIHEPAQPVWRHALTGLVPPRHARPRPGLRIVSSRD